MNKFKIGDKVKFRWNGIQNGIITKIDKLEGFYIHFHYKDSVGLVTFIFKEDIISKIEDK